jgi:hypothetical protein
VITYGPNAGKILLAGGKGADASELSSTELYDPATNRFSPGPAMSAACSKCTATVITSGKNVGNILIFGSYDSRGQTALMELYDAGANKFRRPGDQHGRRLQRDPNFFAKKCGQNSNRQRN